MSEDRLQSGLRDEVKEPRDASWRGPRALSAWVLIPATVLFVGAAAWLLWKAPAYALREWVPGKLTAEDLQRALLPATQSVLFVLGGFIAVIGVVVGLSRHRHELAAGARDRARFEFDREKEEARAREAALLLRTDTERKLRERFVDAVGLMADETSAIKRTAGLYAIASLGDDWAAIDERGERQVCIDVLCAYLRSPGLPNSNAAEEISVRTTGFALIRSHLRGDAAPWKGCRFDFTGARIDYEVDLRDVDLGARTFLDFTGAQIEGHGRLLLHQASGNGRVVLRGLVASVDLVLRETVAPTIDFRSTLLSDAVLDFDHVKLFGSATFDSDGAEFQETMVSADRVRMTEYARFEFRPSVMSGGHLQLTNLRLKDDSAVVFDTTRYTGDAVVTTSGILYEGSAVTIGVSRGIRIIPEPQDEISLQGQARFAVRTFVCRDQSRVDIQGVTVEAGAEFDAEAAVRARDGNVSVAGVEGDGSIRVA